MTANESYKVKQQEIKSLIQKLKDDLKKHERSQKNNPNNWGYVGELAGVLSDLKNASQIIK